MPLIRTLLFIFLITSDLAFADTNSNQAALLIQEQNGTNAGRYRVLKVTNGTTTNNGDGSISVTTGSGGGGASQWITTANVGIGTTDNVGIGTLLPMSKLDVEQGGIAGELVNKGYELIYPSPSLFSAATSSTEIQGLYPYKGTLYIGYFYNVNNNPSASQSTVYTWDGNKGSFLYTLGIGSEFGGIKPIQEYNGNLYIGNQNAPGGAASGSVYVLNTGTISNFVQMNGIAGGNRNSAVTIPNDSTNNAIFGSTAYSVEYYGRVDDLGASNSGNIIRKFNSSNTSGYRMNVAAGNVVDVQIRDTATRTTTTSTTFTIGNYHDFIFSWATGSSPKIYIDGVEASYTTSTSVGTPADDTANTLILGNNVTNNGMFGGTFRKLRIWRNYALTASDVTSLVGGGSAASSPTGEYLFTEGSGTTTADSSGNGNTGTLVSPAYWNNNLFDLSYCSGSDTGIYSMTVFKGKLYAGAAFSASRIYAFDGTTWSTVYSGLAGSGLVTSLYVYQGKLFASLSGSAGNNSAILSTIDGITWTVESLFPFATYTEVNNLQEFKGRLYAVVIKGASGTNDVLVRNNSASTWSSIATLPSSSQVWGMAVYDNSIYLGATATSGGAIIFKSYDGLNFINDFIINAGALGHEAFVMSNYNGSLYTGLGYQSATTGDLWRKTDSLGQQSDWWGVILNKFRQNIYNGYGWPDDPSLLSITTPTTFDSNVGIGTISAGGGALTVFGNVGIGSPTPGQILDVQGTARMTGFQLSTSPSSGYVLTSDNFGVGTWQPASAGGGGTPGAPAGSLQYNSAGSFAAVPNSIADSNGNVGIGTTSAGRQFVVFSPSNVEALLTSTATYGGGSGTNTLLMRADDGAPMTSGTKFGTIRFGAATDSAHTIGDSPGITVYAMGDWSGANRYSRMDFETVNSGGTAASQRMSINGSNIGIGTFLPLSRLAIVGNVGIGSVGASTYVTAPGNPTGGMIIEGNLGVGSFNPNTKVDVIGTVRMTGFNLNSSPTNNYVLTSDSSGNGTWQPPLGGTINSGTTNSPAYYSGPSTISSGNGFYNGSNLGIGTTNNVNLLDVAGGISVGTTYAGYLTPPTNGIAIQGNVGIGTNVDAGNALNIIGNVGIGTGSTGTALNIAQGQFKVNSAGVVTITNGSNSTSNQVAITANNLTTGSALTVISTSGSLTAPEVSIAESGTGNTAAALLLRNSSTTAGGKVFEADDITNDPSPFTIEVNTGNVGIGTILGNGSLDIRNQGVTPLMINSTLTANTGDYLIVNSSGNVGIGSPTPGQLLDVKGNIRASNLGSTLAIASGSNGCQGQATLSGGTVTVSTTCTPATSQGIFLTDATTGVLSNVGTPTVGTVTGGTSFVINSSNVLDSSNVNWWILKAS